jgi:hypothetical protein
LRRIDADIAAVVEAELLRSGEAFERSEEEGRTWFRVASGPHQGSYATGGGKGLPDGAQPLAHIHPLVVAAVANARAWQSGAVELPATEGLAGREGAVGVLRLVKVRYDGFEPVERLVAAAVIDGVPVDPDHARALLSGPAQDPATPVDSDADEALLLDAVEEAVFVDQLGIESGEQEHFEGALARLERFAEDRVMLARRERRGLEASILVARKRREEVVGAEARGRVTASLERQEARLSEVEDNLAQLESRQDQDYRRWQQEFGERRSRAPTVTPLLTLKFRLIPATASPC